MTGTNPDPGRCPGCDAALDARAVEGFCVRCLAQALEGLPTEDRPADLQGNGRIGAYELLGELGRGGMGVVFRARQPGLRREVALKVLRLGPLSASEEVARFRREASAAAQLRHPNIVGIHEVGEADGHVYFSMDLVEGSTLAAAVADGPMDPARAVRILIPVASAVGAAHDRGVVHRDLKPDNILLDAQDEPFVTDFGLATAAGVGMSAVTLEGRMFGSPAYMAPEQADPARGPVGPAADIHALGAILYHLTTGRPPFSAATVAGTLALVAGADPVSPRRLNPNVSRDLETLCLRCLEKEPARRYRSVAELESDLRAVAERRPISARPRGWPSRTWLWARRRPALAGLVLLAATLLGLGVLGVLRERHSRELNLHSADLRLASTALEEGDLGRARELLEAHRSEAPDTSWRMLDRLAEGHPRRVVARHPWIVSAVAWSPDGTHLASGSIGSGTVGAGEIRISEVGAEGEGRRLGGPGVRALEWFPDGRRLLAFHQDGVVRTWDVGKGRIQDERPGRSGGLSRDGRRLLVCGGDPFVWMDELGTNGPVEVVDVSTGTTRLLGESRLAALSPGGQRAALTDLRKQLRVLNASDGSEVARLDVVSDLWSLEFSADGRWLAGTGFGQEVQLWKVDSGQRRPAKLAGHRLPTWHAAFHPDGRRLATSSSDRTIRLWDLESGAPAGLLRGHGSEVWGLDWSADGRFLASGGKDRVAFVWPGGVHRVAPVMDHREYGDLVFSADGGHLVTLPLDRNEGALVWDVGQDEPVPVRIAGPEVLALDAGGQTGWVRGEGFRLRHGALIGDRAGRVIELEHEAGELPGESWAGSRGGRFVGALSGTMVSRWETSTGRRLEKVVIPGMTGMKLILSPGGRASVVHAGEQGFWLVRDGVSRHLATHLDAARGAAFSEDGRWLATAASDALIKVWSVDEGSEVATLRGHLTEVSGVAFAADGVTLASIELGVGLRFWHLPTRRETISIADRQAGDGLQFSPDGRGYAMRLREGGARWVQLGR